MGIYDRDYYGGGNQQQYRFQAPSSMVMTIILINVGIYLVNGLLGGPIMELFGLNLMKILGIPLQIDPQTGPNLNDLMAVESGTLTHPWLWWQYLTYGFAHAAWPNYWHIVGNMLALFFLGRDIEYRLGSKEFLRIYLLMIVLGGIVYNIVNLGAPAGAVGASGAVVGVVVMYAVYYPRRTLLLWGILPMPAWLIGAICILGDLFGASGAAGETHIAHSIHITGALIGFTYAWQNWNTSMLFDRLKWKSRGPRLKVRHPDDDLSQDVKPTRKQLAAQQAEQQREAEIERILQKVFDHGQESLTRREKRIMEEASRRMQKKHRN